MKEQTNIAEETEVIKNTVTEADKAKNNSYEQVKRNLENQLKDITVESKIQMTEILKLYNSLNEKFNDILEKIDKEVDYRDKLQLEIDKRKAECDSIELKKTLAETHANIDVSIETVKRDLKIGLDRINKQEDSFSEEIKNKLKELKTVDTMINEQLNQFRLDMTEANDREYKSLKCRCEALLKESNKRIEEIKNHSIDFLSQCQKQNEVIISKIPEQKIRFNKKDMIIYGISFLCAISLIGQIILSFK